MPDHLTAALLTEAHESLTATARLLERLRASLSAEELLLIQQATAQTGLKPDELPIEFDHERRAEIALLQDRSYFNAGKDKKHQVLPLDGADPRIAKFARAFVKAAHQHGIPCMCTEILRTNERQNQLLAAGRTKARAGQSPHNFGKACDIVHGVKAWDMTARQWGLFGIIGHEIARRQNIKVTWGGNWSFYDPAHWEIAGWKTEG